MWYSLRIRHIDGTDLYLDIDRTNNRAECIEQGKDLLFSRDVPWEVGTRAEVLDRDGVVVWDDELTERDVDDK